MTDTIIYLIILIVTCAELYFVWWLSRSMGFSRSWSVKLGTF
jgi:hypothetical protein